MDLTWFCRVLDGVLPLQWGVVIGASLAAAATDLASRRIPNLLTFPVLAIGLAWAGLHGGWGALGEAAGAMALVSLPFVILFVFAGGGAGDAKLMGAIGAWLGWPCGIVALLAVVLVGAALGLLFALARGRFVKTLSNLGWLSRAFLGVVLTGGRSREALALVPPQEEMQPFPYGLAILGGVILCAGGAFLCSG